MRTQSRQHAASQTYASTYVPLDREDRDSEPTPIVPPGMRPGAVWRVGLVVLAVLAGILLVMQGGWWT